MSCLACVGSSSVTLVVGRAAPGWTEDGRGRKNVGWQVEGKVIRQREEWVRAWCVVDVRGAMLFAGGELGFGR